MRNSFRWAMIGLAVVMLGSCRSTVSKPDAEQKAGVAVTPLQHSKRLVFPWSVVSGGVDSPLSMRAAMQEDPVVNDHYKGLNPAFFRAEVLSSNKQGYASYRVRDKVYWTRRMVTLQAGETVLSDGQFLVRGRCGNLISATPREPVAPAALEPEEPLMDRPVPEAQLLYSPPLPSEIAVETGVLQNPKQIGTDREMTSVLPPPDSQAMLPPVWTAGGSSGGVGGVIATTGAGGGGTTTPPTTTPSPDSPSPAIPIAGTPVVPVWTHFPPIEIAPPLVIASLILPPEAPPNSTVPVIPEHTWPGYTWQHPPTPVYPPGSTPSPPYLPPQISYPPPAVPPPSTPPPGTPPPSGPPPSDPPTGQPPSFDPPSFPPSSPEEDVPIPEPGPWILFALGLAGLAVGTVRRKY
jgi:hypothetical protein